jgi:TonB family protein
MLTQLFNNPALYSLALTLLHFLWQGFLIALVLKSTLLLVPKEKSLTRYTVSSLTMLATLITPLITFYVIYSSIATNTSPEDAQTQLAFLMSEMNSQRSWFDYQALMTALPEFLTFILPYISVAWFVVVSCLSLKLLVELNNVNKLPKTGTVAPESELAERFQLLAKQIDLKRVPKLLISLHVGVPMVIGWLKPVVLLPASMVTGLNNAQLEMLLLHELAHIRRHDYLVNFFQTLVEILFFFHPSIHWISRQMRNEREYCSDDIAVKHCGDAIAYAHTLADTAALHHASPSYCDKHAHTIPELAMAASGGDLKQRIVRLVNHHCTPKKDIGKWFAAASIISTVLFISSQSLIGVSNLAFESKSQKTAKNFYQETFPSSNNFNSLNGELLEENNNNFAEPALTTIAGSLLKNTHNNKNIDSYKEDYLVKEIEPSSVSDVTESTSNIASVSKKTSQVDIKKTQRTNDNIVLAKKKQRVKDEALASITKKVSPVKFAKQTKKISDKTLENSLYQKVIHKPSLNETLSKQTTQQLSPKEETYQLATSNKPKTTVFDEKTVSQGLITHNTPAVHINNTLAILESASESRLTEQIIAFDKGNNLAQASITEQHLLAIKTQSNKVSLSNNLPPSEIKTLDKQAEQKPNKPVLLIAKELKVVNPVYPSMAKRKGIELEVKVNFTIDVDGHIKNIHFARQSKLNYFKSSIKSAIRQWKYVPAKLNNQPIESNMSKIFSFNLQS